jgi:hypothetical protein
MGMGNPLVLMMNPSNWTNPNAYMSFMNPNTHAVMMNPMSYMAFMNPATYMPLMNPASYMSFMNPMSYMQWMNPAAYAIPGMTGAGGTNWFDPSNWGSMVPKPQTQQQQK